MNIQEQLEYLRSQIHSENISYSEISDLHSFVKYIDKNDTELLAWIGEIK